MAKAQYWRGFQVSIDHHFGDLLLLARSGSAGSKSRIISCVFGNSQTNAIAPIIQNISIGRVSKMPTSPYEIPNTVCHEPLSAPLNAPLNAVGSMMPFPPNMDLTIRNAGREICRAKKYPADDDRDKRQRNAEHSPHPARRNVAAKFLPQPAPQMIDDQIDTVQPTPDHDRNNRKNRNRVEMCNTAHRPRPRRW